MAVADQSVADRRRANLFDRSPSLRSVAVFSGRWAARIGVFVAVVVVWEWVVDSGRANEVILPSPSRIWAAFRALFATEWTVDSPLFFFQPFFREHFTATIAETALGFAIGASIGLALATVMTMWPVIRPFLSDYIVAFEAIPKVALIPLFVAWFGIGASSKVALAITITFFPVFLTAYSGMNTVPEDYTMLTAQLRSSRLQRMTKLQFPHCLPTLFAGLKQALANSLIGAIVAEFFGAREGLGYLISIYSFQIRTDRLFAVLIIISIIALVFFLLLDFAAKRLCFWAQGGLADITDI